jgi:hypothetical protein
LAKRGNGFSARLVSSAKHHSGVVSSVKAITINGADWPISDTADAFVTPLIFFSGEPAFSGECASGPSPLWAKSA